MYFPFTCSLASRSSLLAGMAALCLSAPMAVQAQQPATLSPAFAACMDRSGGVTAAMHECIAAEHRLQDQQLNRNYKALMAELTPARKQQLKAAQRLWLQYREANCGFYADPDGGTLAGIAAADCVLQMTANRARELADLNH
ncbi:lysozyme inhibitor LprI family protein [Comamonas jiangduensis]|uniref:lysozyme inhibitor LprI family protein n=1 Tax=Comamonas jiangduensis TaxID=1194168 RepID=UPI003BF785E4